MKKLKFIDYFYLFLFGSVVGWIVECIFSFIKRGIFINHSALVIGPFNVIYGISACVLTLLLLNINSKNNFIIFIISFISGTILEYIASLGMEYIVGFTAWNYQRYFLNINGRVCLLYSIYWGLLGVLWIKYLYPKISKIVEKIKNNLGYKWMYIIIVFLILDLVLTISAVNRAHDFDAGIPAHNKYERFLDNTFNSDFLKNMFNNKWETKTK